jgi:hypothetical protein
MVIALASAIAAALVLGGYLSLRPYVFILGLVATVVVSLWASQGLATGDLLVLFLVTLVTALLDEWVHTSAGVFSYYDQLKPSPLTVFGWSLFILSIVALAKVVSARVPLESLETPRFRSLPVIATAILLFLSAWQQGYLDVFGWTMVLLYTAHIAASILYTSRVPLTWSLWVMLTGMLLGGAMELIGSLEGTWSYRSGEPLVFFMVFTWALRTWTILSISRVLGVDIHSEFNP